MKFVFVLLFSWIFLCLIDDVTADVGPQLWLVQKSGSNDPTIRDLSDSGLVDVWSHSPDVGVKILVENEAKGKVKKALAKGGLLHSVIVDDVFHLIRQETEFLQEKKRRRTKRSAGHMDWAAYHDLGDIEGYVGWLNFTAGELVNVFQVARTDERRPVYVVRVSDPSSLLPKKVIWIEGGIHAREWISPAVTTYIMHQVAVNPTWRELLANTEWYFVPVANPDGYAYSFTSPRNRLWRKNRSNSILGAVMDACNGVDLNRNWDFKWGVGASSNPCSSTYKGSEPFSEAETRGLMKFMSTVGHIDLFITFHSFGQTVLYPFGWSRQRPPNEKDLIEMAKRFSEVVKFHSSGNTIYEIGSSGPLYGIASGATDDWAYGAINVPLAYTIELRDKGDHGFLLPESQVSDAVKESASGVYCMASYLSGVGQCALVGEVPLPSNVNPRNIRFFGQ